MMHEDVDDEEEDIILDRRTLIHQTNDSNLTSNSGPILLGVNRFNIKVYDDPIKMSQTKIILLATTCVAIGMFTGLLGPTFPFLSQHMQVDLSSIVWLIALKAIGFLFGTFLSAYLYSWFNVCCLLGLSCLSISFGVCSLPLITDLATFYLTSVILGMALAISYNGIDTLYNRLWTRPSLASVRWLHLLVAFGAILSTLMLFPSTFSNKNENSLTTISTGSPRIRREAINDIADLLASMSPNDTENNFLNQSNETDFTTESVSVTTTTGKVILKPSVVESDHLKQTKIEKPPSENVPPDAPIVCNKYFCCAHYDNTNSNETIQNNPFVCQDKDVNPSNDCKNVLTSCQTSTAHICLIDKTDIRCRMDEICENDKKPDCSIQLIDTAMKSSTPSMITTNASSTSASSTTANVPSTSASPSTTTNPPSTSPSPSPTTTNTPSTSPSPSPTTTNTPSTSPSPSPTTTNTPSTSPSTINTPSTTASTTIVTTTKIVTTPLPTTTTIITTRSTTHRNKPSMAESNKDDLSENLFYQKLRSFFQTITSINLIYLFLAFIFFLLGIFYSTLAMRGDNLNSSSSSTKSTNNPLSLFFGSSNRTRHYSNDRLSLLSDSASLKFVGILLLFYLIISAIENSCIYLTYLFGIELKFQDYQSLLIQFLFYLGLLLGRLIDILMDYGCFLFNTRITNRTKKQSEKFHLISIKFCILIRLILLFVLCSTLSFSHLFQDNSPTKTSFIPSIQMFYLIFFLIGLLIASVPTLILFWIERDLSLNPTLIKLILITITISEILFPSVLFYIIKHRVLTYLFYLFLGSCLLLILFIFILYTSKKWQRKKLYKILPTAFDMEEINTDNNNNNNNDDNQDHEEQEYFLTHETKMNSDYERTKGLKGH